MCFRDADGNLHTQVAVVQDVYARGGAEFVLLSTGETLRLDQLVQVGDARFSDY